LRAREHRRSRGFLSGGLVGDLAADLVLGRIDRGAYVRLLGGGRLINGGMHGP
jgi:hypothetical protein